MTVLDRLVEQCAAAPVVPVLGGVAVALAERLGVDPDQVVAPSLLVDAVVPCPDGEELTIDLLGALHERSQLPATRRRRGSHYTPAAIADGLVALARGDWAVDPPRRVWDPTAGGGAFLLAVGRSMEADGLDRGEIVGRLYGTDVDGLAVAVCRTSLALWAGVPYDEVNVATGDSLAEEVAPDAVDLVIGNPPFLSPLAAATAPDDARRSALADRFASAYGPYVDAAALFQLVAADALGPGGRLALIQPLSFLAARDSAEVRRLLAERCRPRSLWVAGEKVFDASVEVCAVVYERESSAGPIELRAGRSFERAGAVASGTPLAAAAARASAIPPVRPPVGPTIGEVAEVTAGFRDEYYAIAEATTEAGPGPRVVTVGRLGPLRLDPDERPVRIQRRDYRDPRVDMHALHRRDARVARWVERLAVPKVLVATQTTVIEVVADPDGDLVPLTPVVAVVVPTALVWPMAALLTAPALSALAAARSFGTARHGGALKLAAREIRALPAPQQNTAWREAGELARAAQTGPTTGWADALDALAECTHRLLGVDDPAVAAWWRDRLLHAVRRSGLHPDRSRGPL